MRNEQSNDGNLDRRIEMTQTINTKTVENGWKGVGGVKDWNGSVVFLTLFPICFIHDDCNERRKLVLAMKN